MKSTYFSNSIMRMKYVFILISVILSSESFASFKDKLPVKWGKITPAEFAVKPAGIDANAAAIVLCDYGNIQITNRTFYTRHTRIKILNENGLKYASVEIPYQTRNKHDVFYELKAQTLVYENGKIIKYPVTSKDIDDIKINEKWSKKKFIFPMVSPGAIIEFQYKIASLDFEKLDSWYFQREIPTIWSEIRFDVPEPFYYLVSFDNNRELDADEEAVYGQKLQWLYDTGERKKRSEFIESNNLLFNTAENRFKVWVLNDMKKKVVMKNLPGLSSSSDNQPDTYLYPQLRFDLFESKGNLPRMFRPLLLTTHSDYETMNEWSLLHDRTQFIGYVHYRLKTWNQFNEQLMENDRFGTYLIKRNSDVNLKSLLENRNEVEKVNAIYNYVRENYKWNGQFSQYANQDFKKFIEKKSGSSAELNLLLINLFKQYGIKSNPVLIRTKDLGPVEKMYPVKDQFNHVIASVEIGDKEYLFDVTSNTSELNKLNKLDIGTQGWIVSKDNMGWIEIYSGEGDSNTNNNDLPVFRM